jgi:ABC-type polysaccharide/polyol phosphate transport system ATPase subunit
MYQSMKSDSYRAAASANEILMRFGISSDCMGIGPEPVSEAGYLSSAIPTSLLQLEDREAVARMIKDHILSRQPRANVIWIPPCTDLMKPLILTRFTKNDSLKDFQIDQQKLSLAVADGERVQLRHDFLEGPQSSVSVHYLLEIQASSAVDPVIAIRWLYQDADEEVMVRIRSSSTIVGKSIEVPFGVGSGAALITLERYAGRNQILINGIPIYVRLAGKLHPSGVVIDAIGVEGASVTVDVSLMAVDCGNAGPLLSDREIAQWRDLALTSASRNRNISMLAKIAFGLDGIEDPIESSAYTDSIEFLNSNSGPYPDYIFTSLRARSPANKVLVHPVKVVEESYNAPLVVVDRVSVAISRNTGSFLSELINRRRTRETRILLQDITFDAYPGDIIGVIGKNGAGKTTLLKTLVAAMPISQGIIRTTGHPILLRPGAGMQGELSGRENILRAAIYMGYLPEEIEPHIEDIIEFAELAEHIDRPFRTYSDGMKARLIFSVATAFPRDILLLDELLSAGDAGFQRKATKRLDGFIGHSKLVVVVQHTFDFVLARCSKCLLLDRGRQLYFGDPSVAIEMYKESL